MISELGLRHFIGHRFDLALRIIAGIAGLRMSNDGRARKSTIIQEVIVVMALCWPEDDADHSVVYFNIEVGFGRLLHWSLSDPSAVSFISCMATRSLARPLPAKAYHRASSTPTPSKRRTTARSMSSYSMPFGKQMPNSDAA